MKTKSRILAALMAFIMIVGMLPISAFAEGETTSPANETRAQTEETTAPTPEQNTTTLPEQNTTQEQNLTTQGDSTEEPPSPTSYTLTLKAEPDEGGTVEGGGSYGAGTEVTVKATASDSYVFTAWYEDAEERSDEDKRSEDAEYTFTLNGDLTLCAVFTQQPQADEQAPATPTDGESGELPGPSEDKKKDDNGGDSEVSSETQQDPAPEQVVSALEASPMLRSAPQALNAPLQNDGPRAGQTFYLDLKYEGSGGARASTYTGTEGSVVSINAYPTDGYRFKNWEIVSGTGSIGDEYNANTTFTMGTTDATVKAVFEILPAGGNSLVCFAHSGGTASATANPNDSAVYTLQATPASGYKFVSWAILQGNGSIDDKNAASTTIRNCSGSVVVEAQFSTITYPITTNANPSEGGSTKGLPYWGGPAQQVELTATPNGGYVFKEWKITSGKGRITNPTEACTVLTDITEAVTCQAGFELIPSGQYGVSVTKNLAEMGEAKANVPYGSPGTEVTLTATPASGYRFTRWEVTPANVVLTDSNSATTTFQIGSEDVTVKAFFDYDASYKTATQTDGCGKVYVGNNELRSGKLQQLTVTPESGWSFDHWEVVSGGVTIDNEYAREASFVMRDQDVVVKAIFVPEQTNLLTEIKVKTPPKKDTYTAGESFDPDGMVVTAYYQNGTTDVSGYTYEPSGALAETDTLITIRYTINDVTKETTLPITVSPRSTLKVSANDITVTYTGNAVADSQIQGVAEFGGVDVPGSWTFKPGEAVTNVLDSGTKTVVFTPDDDTNYATMETTLTLTIEKATPTVTGVSVTSPATVYDSTAIGDIVLGFTDDSSGGSIELNDNQTLEVGTKDYNWTYTPADPANYNSVTGTVSITVEAAPVTPVTVTEIKPETTPPSPTYEATVQAVTWQKGSGKNLDLTFKRSENDHLTYGLFGSLEIGGVTVGSANYSAAEGSLKLSIKPEYLETLSVGDHTVKVNFRDGSATVKLTVLAAATQPQKLDERSTAPNTGDESNLALWSSLMFLSVAGMLVVAVAAKRHRKER